MSDEQKSPNLFWELGTAYELLISLYVLHMPEHFGIRASWAAGIRSRIPAAERKLLDDILPFIGFPLRWIRALPGTRDAISALWALKQMPPAGRMPHILGLDCCESDWEKNLSAISQRGSWQESDLEYFRKMIKEKGEEKLDDARITRFLDRWVDQESLGEGYLSALQAFYNSFFEDEEKRLLPILQSALDHARELSSRLTLPDLLRELSQGVQLSDMLEIKNLVILPAYWTTPLVLFEHIDKDTMLLFFGARSAEMPAIPGDMVPESLVRVMKALADPTRLKILYYLAQETLTPSELARRLSLRAPTVTHHLNELRLSGLLNLTIKGQEKQYQTREESLDAMCTNLKGFLHTQQPVK